MHGARLIIIPGLDLLGLFEAHTHCSVIEDESCGIDNRFHVNVRFDCQIRLRIGIIKNLVLELISVPILLPGLYACLGYENEAELITGDSCR